MKIALIGYGKMGKMIDQLAEQNNHTIIARLSNPDWDPKDLKEADVCIEFTKPDSVIKNIEKAAAAKKNIVVGTTGWQEHLQHVEHLAFYHNIGILHSSNYSIGVQLFLRMIDDASLLINPFEEFDIAGIEFHHKEKKDRPSGTALTISQLIASNVNRIESVPFSSIRCGTNPGVHSIVFDGPSDVITLTHESRNRAGFAKGALLAAEWLKERSGMFTFTECLDQLLKGKKQ